MRLIYLTGLVISFLAANFPGKLWISFSCLIFFVHRCLLKRPRSIFHSPDAPWLFLGFHLPLAGLIGPGALLGACYGLFLFQREHIRFYTIRWAIPFVFICFAWAVARVFWDFDPFLYREIWNSAPGIGRSITILQHAIEVAPPAWLLALVSVTRMVAIALVAVHLKASSSSREHFKRGALISLIGALLIGILQLRGIQFPNQNSYWNGLGRLPGASADPNALALIALLVIPFFFSNSLQRIQSKALLIGGLTLSLFLGLISGSRSYLLGLFLYAALWLFQRSRISFLLVTVLLATTVTLGFGARSQLNESIRSLPWVPVGVRRAVESIEPQTASTALFSRQAFFMMDLAMWADRPITGVGFYRFRDSILDYQRRLGFDLGTWTDNPNSFYLGVLAELGLIGALLLLLLFLNFSLKSVQGPADKAERSALIVLLLLLIVGPHLEFDEVAILFGLLIAVATTQRQTLQPGIWAVPLAVVYLVYTFFSTSYRERGFYPWERVQGIRYHWSARKAHGALACDTSGKAVLRLRALNPDLAQNPLEVKLTFPDREVRDFLLKDSSLLEIPISCPNFSEIEPRFHVKNILYDLEVSRIWIPAHTLGGDDYRPLGVQVMDSN